MKTLKYLPFAMALILSGCGEKTPPAAEAPPPAPAATVAAAPAPAMPVAPTPVASVASAGDLVKGEQVYTATCLSCHGAGVLGAPKFGDKAVWAPRIAQGVDTLHANAINGVKMMPPRGGNASLTDGEVKAAVDYMLSKSS